MTTTLGVNELAQQAAALDVEKNASGARGTTSHHHRGHHHHRLLKMKHLHHKPGMTSLEDGADQPFWERYVSRTVKNNSQSDLRASVAACQLTFPPVRAQLSRLSASLSARQCSC